MASATLALPLHDQATAPLDDGTRLLDDPSEWEAFGRPLPTAEGRWESYLAIEGMHCPACALTVEQALQPLPGVHAVQVNGASAIARIEWLPAQAGQCMPSTAR